MQDREQALALLNEYTTNQSLIKHALSVEACMAWYAEYYKVPADEVLLWKLTGLLHDFDYERFPEPIDPGGHPYEGNRILKELNYPESLRDAIMGHALYTNTPRISQMSKVLFAVDELSGLITASVLVRPDKSIKMLEAKSVLKKMKDKAFARGCNRDDIRLGAQDLGIELEVHITNCILAMRDLPFFAEL